MPAQIPSFVRIGPSVPKIPPKKRVFPTSTHGAYIEANTSIARSNHIANHNNNPSQTVTVNLSATATVTVTPTLTTGYPSKVTVLRARLRLRLTLSLNSTLIK